MIQQYTWMVQQYFENKSQCWHCFLIFYVYALVKNFWMSQYKEGIEETTNYKHTAGYNHNKFYNS